MLLNLDFTESFFEGDSALVINAISQGNAALSLYVNIVEDICGLLSGFQTSDVMHVHRSCNMVADALAKKAKDLLGWASGLVGCFA